MRILVTGGAGFIGSHVADAYVKQGHTVSIIDNFHTGFKHNLPKGIKHYNVDIRDFAAVKKVLQQAKPQVISHHAAIAAVSAGMNNPTETYDVNVNGTINLLINAVDTGVQRFIFSSTGGVMYGDGAKLPTKESSLPEPTTAYALSKRLGEEAIVFHSRIKRRGKNLEYVIFRYANVFGPRQNPKGESGVCAIFSQLLADGKQPVIFGDGSKTRDYVYIKDIVRANILALKKGTNQTMNIGSGKQITDDQVFSTIAKYYQTNFDKPIKPTYAKPRAGEQVRSALHSGLAKKVLGWQPSYSFAEGINEYLT